MWLLIKYQKFSHAFFKIFQKKAATGGPLLKWFSVLPIPLPWFLAYIRASVYLMNYIKELEIKLEILFGFRNLQEKLEKLFFFQVPKGPFISLVEFQVPSSKIQN